MFNRRRIQSVLLGCATSLFLCCASSQYAPAFPDKPGLVQPRDDSERKILEVIGELKPEEPAHIANTHIVVGESYASASGRICRPIRMSQEHDSITFLPQLACKDKDSWYFVPDVFVSHEPVGVGP